jgi:lipoate-protein ligase A
MKRRTKFVAGGAALLAAAAAGGAIGATQLTPKQESQAVINDAAEQLGVEPNELSDALKQALKNRVDDAVEDGRLTKEQGQRLKERIDANDMPFLGPIPFGRGHHEHHFFHAKLEAAAKYLGLSEAELRTALENGKTLAQVARDRDKSVDGLVDALVENAEQKLDDAVEAGRLTEAEKREMLEGLRERTGDLVNGRFPLPRHGFRRMDRGAFFRPAVF